AKVELDNKDVQVFIKDGAIVSFEDLAVGDLIYVNDDGAKNTDLMVIAVSEVKEGKLERAHASWADMTIDGTKIKRDNDTLVSTDNGKDFDLFDPSNQSNDDMFGENIKYMLSPAGSIAVVISGVEETQELFGVVEYAGVTARGIEARILTADGTK